MTLMETAQLLGNFHQRRPADHGYDQEREQKRAQGRKREASGIWRRLSGCDNLGSVAAEAELRLFEGFVSFKPMSEVTDHSKDVVLLREVTQSPSIYDDAIVDPSSLRRNPTDTLQSAFKVLGKDYGIPPVIRR